LGNGGICDLCSVGFFALSPFFCFATTARSNNVADPSNQLDFFPNNTRFNNQFRNVTRMEEIGDDQTRQKKSKSFPQRIKDKYTTANKTHIGNGQEYGR
jgi:hypothetical protein